MTNMTRFPLESVMNVNSIVKVNHTVKCEIILLLNDKQDEVPSRICRECQFYSQSEKANVKYMIHAQYTNMKGNGHESIGNLQRT